MIPPDPSRPLDGTPWRCHYCGKQVDPGNLCSLCRPWCGCRLPVGHPSALSDEDRRRIVRPTTTPAPGMEVSE